MSSATKRLTAALLIAATTLTASSTGFAEKLKPLDGTGCLTLDCYNCLLDQKYQNQPDHSALPQEEIDAQCVKMNDYFRKQYQRLFPKLARHYSTKERDKEVEKLLISEDKNRCGVKLRALMEATNNGKEFQLPFYLENQANQCLGKAKHDYLSHLNGHVKLTDDMRNICVNSDINKPYNEESKFSSDLTLGVILAVLIFSIAVPFLIK